jgi:hypothetical protein
MLLADSPGHARHALREQDLDPVLLEGLDAHEGDGPCGDERRCPTPIHENRLAMD